MPFSVWFTLALNNNLQIPHLGHSRIAVIMRFSHFSVFALSGLSIASPVLSKRADVVSLLTDLYASVQVYTGAISESSHRY